MKLNRTNKSMTFGRVGSVMLLSGLLASCGGEDGSATIPTQQWQGVEIRVESRPMPPQAGMNEFLVMATRERGRPAFDLMVSLRTSDQDAWRQAIQDGQVGVYRRAVDVESGERSVLQVQIKRKGEESVLRFPLGVVAK